MFICAEGVVVSSCFHTGYFLLRQLRPLSDAAHKGVNVEAFADDFDTFVNDFCVQHQEVMPKRKEFVQALNSIQDQT